ncbi:copper resistance protein NlpE N-terminal domain-containing protein [Lysobacter sp. F60174L2]|uniref:copper resistance protein NlpE N-terminal domain-containing protein n=1 Tax=Lysobacter sp. F60174L2 TaxID=3459295 RepID=UPI00403DF9BC
MNKPLLALACLTVIAVAACQPEPAATTTAAPGAAETAPAPVDVAPAGEDLSSDNAGFDMKGFAGTFSGTLPCADCPGIDTTLVLNPDGTYEISEAYQDSDGVVTRMDGTWTVEADDSQVRLDPNSKSEQDRLYAITSNEEITMLDLEGNPAESGLDYSLDRQPAN